MAILDKLHLRRREEAPSEVQAVENSSSICPHVSLLPRWEDADSIGHDDRASYWVCASCEQTFTPEEVLELRRTEHERLQQYVSN